MTPKLFLCLSLSFIGLITHAQTITGVVLDANTKIPIETASVYFDNTTFGTITDENGKFSMSYSNAIKSSLVISYLGYKTQLITDYRREKSITVFLEENPETLGEVLINADDGMSRRQKLKLFRREFLGTSNFGKSCTILNENDIIIRYNKKERELTAYSKAPIHIENKALQYHITYDLASFTLQFMPRNDYNSAFDVKSVGFFGNSYYKDFKIFNEQKAVRNRNKAYNGSRLQFIRALYMQKLKENKYQILLGNTKVNPWEYFFIESKSTTEIKEVYLLQPLNILFNDWEQSSIQFVIPSVFIDFYGNYTDADKVHFSGAMGEQRVGELLPFDYGL